jgi:hypothetical protein
MGKTINTDRKQKGIWSYELISSDTGQGPVAGSCEHGNESSGFIKVGLSKRLLASQEAMSPRSSCNPNKTSVCPNPRK